MKEYWVNVYKYPKIKEYLYSHNCPTRADAEMYSHLYWEYRLNSNRKTVYRIKVTLK